MEKQNKMLATGIEKIILNEGTEPKNTETNKIQLNDAWDFMCQIKSTFIYVFMF